jgi:hypothetical protein
MLQKSQNFFRPERFDDDAEAICCRIPREHNGLCLVRVPSVPPLMLCSPSKRRPLPRPTPLQT